MPRTGVPAELTAALASGQFTPYFLVEMGHMDGAVFHVLVSVMPVAFRLERTSMTVKFQMPAAWWGYSAANLKFTRLTRGVTISGTNYTISTSRFYTINADWDGIFVTVTAQLLPDDYYSVAGDVTYHQITDTVLTAFGLTHSWQKPTATWLNYQFLPTGKLLYLSQAYKFFEVLKQKYLIWTVDNGGQDVLFCSIPDKPASPYDHNPLNVYKLVAPLFSARKRYYVSHDESDVVHYAGTSTDPLYNLGFLHSTASAPSVYACLPRYKIDPIPINLNILSFDSAYCVTPYGVDLVIDCLDVVEVFDYQLKQMPWHLEINYCSFFGDTEGGDLPAAVEYAAPFTPINTSNFTHVLSPADSNIQRAFDTLDNHLHPEHLLVSLADYANDFLVATGANAWARMGLADVKDLVAPENEVVHQSIANYANDFLVASGANNFVRANPASARTAMGLDAGGAGDIWVEKDGDTMTGDLLMGNYVLGGNYTGLTDDTVVSFAQGAGTLIIVHESTNCAEGGIFFVRSNVCTAILLTANCVSAGSTLLTNGTANGTDGKLNVSENVGTIYIKNRLGATRTVRWNIFY